MTPKHSKPSSSLIFFHPSLYKHTFYLGLNKQLFEKMKAVETKEGLILEVTVKPRARDFKILVKGEEIIVHCKEEPTKGKVNKELIKELTRLLHRQVELVSGFTSKQKKLLIKTCDKKEFERLLLEII